MTRKSRFTDRQVKGMVKEYREGSTIRDLAVAFECSTPTVIRLLHEGGLKKLRTKGRREKHDYSKPTTQTKHDIKYQRALKAQAKAERAKAKAKKAASKPAKKAPRKSVKTDSFNAKKKARIAKAKAAMAKVKADKPKTSQKKSKKATKPRAKKATKKAA